MASVRLARSLSTSADSFARQPNVQVFGTEGRYAHALFSAASKNKTLDKTEKEIKELQVASL
jgi:F-type H+-transporting ATPase subunit O